MGKTLSILTEIVQWRLFFLLKQIEFYFSNSRNLDIMLVQHFTVKDPKSLFFVASWILFPSSLHDPR